MKDDFFWSPIDDSGPFGSDGGSDAAYGFYHWRQSNPSGSPIVYLQQLFNSWHYPILPWDEMDTVKISAFMNHGHQLSEEEIQKQVQMLKSYNANSSGNAGGKKPSDEELRNIVLSAQKSLGATYLMDQDQAIVGTAFAQFVLEGKLDPKLKYYTIRTLQREMLPIFGRSFGNADQQKTHIGKLKKMLAVIESAK